MALTGQPRETGALGTPLTCDCGHVEIVAADRQYRIALWPCWAVDVATSTVAIVDRPRYICESCYEALPDGDESDEPDGE